MLRVTTSCSGRFHIYDQARQLLRHGVLYRLISDYPRWVTRRWGIPDDRADSLLLNGVLGRIARYTPRILSPMGQSRFAEKIHHSFSSRLARVLPLDSDAFIGLSSFALEALEKAIANGVLAITDHGSLHLKTEWNLLAEERERLGLPSEDYSRIQWAIDKENAEFSMADCVLVLSSVARRSMIENGVSPDKIFVNPCGVDLSRFRRGFRHDDVFRVAFCGGINARKGVHYLLRAFSELNLKKAELWLIGGGAESSELAPLLARYRSDAIKLIGPVPQSELPRLYSQCSMFVLPSLADGFGMVVPQAMACGLPVIVTENVGAADIVEEGVNGFIVPIRDTEALKQRILQLYLDSELWSEMARAATTRARADLSWDGYGDRLVAHLQSLRERKKANAIRSTAQCNIA